MIWSVRDVRRPSSSSALRYKLIQTLSKAKNHNDSGMVKKVRLSDP